jgi:hypothetical protein
MDAVDLSLVLALDGSASVTYDEFGLIAGGLARAFRDPQIIAGLTGGAAGASQCAVVLWSGRDAQEVLIDWTRIASPADAQGFADAVDNVPRAVTAGLTAIGAALLVALDLLGRAPAAAERQVVDVAGDGRSNDGPAPGPVRDRMAAMGITINGLCVLHEEADLLDNYQREVVGGPASFALACPDYAAFAEAMRQKLQRELVS